MVGGGDEAFRRTLLALYIVAHTDLHAAPEPSTAGTALGKFAFRSDTACSAAFWPAPSGSCTLYNQEKGDDARLRRSTPLSTRRVDCPRGRPVLISWSERSCVREIPFPNSAGFCPRRDGPGASLCRVQKNSTPQYLCDNTCLM